MQKVELVVKGRKAFTLVELLIVVAILAILAAILFPVFARARENARRASCASNLKQIGIAIMMYTQDYDERTPMAHTLGDVSDPSDPATDVHKWMDAIYPYAKSEQLFVCPSDSTSNAYVYYKKLPAGNTAKAFGSYAWNTAYAGDPSYHSASFTTLAAIDYPSSTVMVTDATGNISEYGCSTVANCNAIAAPSGSPLSWNGVPARHLDTTNVLFADGHVKAMRLSSLLEKKTDNGNPIYHYLAANID